MVPRDEHTLLQVTGAWNSCHRRRPLSCVALMIGRPLIGMGARITCITSMTGCLSMALRLHSHAARKDARRTHGRSDEADPKSGSATTSLPSPRRVGVADGDPATQHDGLVDDATYVVIDWPGWGTATTVRPSMPSKSAGLQV